MNVVMVISPHADDETLGCGGTLLRHRNDGDQIHWLLVSGMVESIGYLPEQIKMRQVEINEVSKYYEFDSKNELDFPAGRLDELPLNDLVSAIGKQIEKITPNYLYLPYPGDAHSDHKITFQAATACTKWFRYPSIKRVLAYETLSETEFGLSPQDKQFQPNSYVDISNYLETKIEIMKTYKGEIQDFPGPRSEEVIRALASIRGSQVGCRAAEAFSLIKEVS